MGIKGLLSGMFGRGQKSISSSDNPYSGTRAANLLIQPYSMAGRFGWIDVRQNLSWQYYKEISIIRDAIDLGALNFVSVPFAIKNKKTGELTTEFDPKVPATNLLKLLESPNEDISESEFKSAHYKSYKVTGETFFVSTISSNEEPLEMFYINPRNVSAITNEEDIVTSFNIYTGLMKGHYVRTPLHDRIVYRTANGERYLWQMKTLNPDQGNACGRGFSPLSSVYYEIEQFGGVSKHNSSMLRNGVRPSGALIPNSGGDGMGAELSDNQLKQIKDSVQQFYGGYNNAGNVMVLDGIKEFKELSLNNKDMEFMNLLERITEQVYRSLGIPLPLVNAKTMTLRNYQEAKFMLYDGNIIPFSMCYAEELTRFLMPFYDPSGDYELIPHLDKIHALEERKLDKFERFRDSITDNEIREFLGFEPIEGGDILAGRQVMIEADKASKEDYISAMRDTGKFSETEIQEKANSIYGCH